VKSWSWISCTKRMLLRSAPQELNNPEPTLVNRAAKAASAAHLKNAPRREFPAADVSRVLGMIDVWAEVKQRSCVPLQYARSK
jgi:hypothetical protein